MKKIRRLTALLLSAAMISSAAAGCKSKSPDSQADRTSSSAPAEAPKQSDIGSGTGQEAQEEVVLEVQIVDTNWADAWNLMKESFESQYPWITLESVGAQQNIDSFISARIAARDLPALIKISSTDIYLNMIDEGYVRDVSGLECVANVPDKFREAFTYNGVEYGVTQGASFSALYLNMEALKEAGWDTPPSDWDQFIQCCKDIKEKTDYAPFLFNGDHATICYMVYELLLANCLTSQEEAARYQEALTNGTFDFSAYPDIRRKMNELIPYIMEGSASTAQDDAVAIMADGGAAMLLGGNWVSASALEAIESYTGVENSGLAIFPPFNDPGKPLWISTSTEVGFGLTTQDDPKVSEAADLFLNWIFEPENFKIIQNARGTVPVLTNMTSDQIVLPEGIKGLVSEVSGHNSVMMGYNFYTAEFKDGACTALRDVYSGNASIEDAAASMTQLLSQYHN